MIYQLPDDLRAALLGYLVTRPMREVEAMVVALRDLQEQPVEQSSKG